MFKREAPDIPTTPPVPDEPQPAAPTLHEALLPAGSCKGLGDVPCAYDTNHAGPHRPATA